MFFIDSFTLFGLTALEVGGSPHPGTEPVLPAVEAQSLNHWTTREVPLLKALLLYVPASTVTVENLKPD